MDVLRYKDGKISVGHKFYEISDIVDVVEVRLVDAGSQNIAFDFPPILFSGSPYGEFIDSLGLRTVEPSKEMPEFLPRYNKRAWSRRLPIWPVVFGLDPLLMYDNWYELEETT